MNRKERNYQVISKIKSFHCNNGECSSHLESKECGGSQPWSLSRGTQTCHYQDQNHKKHPFREEKHRQTNQNQSRERERELQIQNISVTPLLSPKPGWMDVFQNKVAPQLFIFCFSEGGPGQRNQGQVWLLASSE